ncbi:hypothetical protein [Geminocystis sp. NIES-3709]|uniref:hypothetical protein n=1 Tax=Geminocystis sp. NIES-3709 TaxID=1617448 RepID=UPI0005FC3994|nr:hypothetical protein [Geminocystis sp. NIES-3709]BAQ64093.1 hypothetical protein GM3709_858 [Geminocystis sp. NIES-3709]
MSKIEEVKAKIREGNIETAMAMAMAEAMKLEIVTTVNDGDNSSHSQCYRSNIDLLNNEIDHQLDEVQNNNQIEKLHFHEVEKSHEKILQNVQSLQKMFNLLQESLNEIS